MTSYLQQIDKTRLPKHIAIIMDGNGRWAKAQGFDRSYGHKKGVDSVRVVTEAATEIGIKYLTLYTFSTENWNRPKEEIDALMALMVMAIERETPDLIKNGVRLQAIGNLDRMPEEVRARLNKCISDTAQGTGVTLVLALSYSSRWEIVDAVKKISSKVKNGEMAIEDINEDTITSSLTTSQIPDPDLLIRTGGEERISNFLMWQISYSELYFTSEYWPEFGKESLYKAICNYQSRERRFGKTSEQL
ncbi:MAG: isoprenyl transferase [Muribaculaceae bacterium]|nr:isoprenyl transferase [Muribaculaceae bacterium]